MSINRQIDIPVKHWSSPYHIGRYLFNKTWRRGYYIYYTSLEKLVNDDIAISKFREIIKKSIQNIQYQFPHTSMEFLRGAAEVSIDQDKIPENFRKKYTKLIEKIPPFSISSLWCLYEIEMWCYAHHYKCSKCNLRITMDSGGRRKIERIDIGDIEYCTMIKSDDNLVCFNCYEQFIGDIRNEDTILPTYRQESIGDDSSSSSNDDSGVDFLGCSGLYNFDFSGQSVDMSVGPYLHGKFDLIYRFKNCLLYDAGGALCPLGIKDNFGLNLFNIYTSNSSGFYEISGSPLSAILWHFFLDEGFFQDYIDSKIRLSTISSFSLIVSDFKNLQNIHYEYYGGKHSKYLSNIDYMCRTNHVLLSNEKDVDPPDVEWIESVKRLNILKSQDNIDILSAEKMFALLCRAECDCSIATVVLTLNRMFVKFRLSKRKMTLRTPFYEYNMLKEE